MRRKPPAAISIDDDSSDDQSQKPTNPSSSKPSHNQAPVEDDSESSTDDDDDDGADLSESQEETDLMHLDKDDLREKLSSEVGSSFAMHLLLQLTYIHNTSVLSGMHVLNVVPMMKDWKIRTNPLQTTNKVLQHLNLMEHWRLTSVKKKQPWTLLTMNLNQNRKGDLKRFVPCNKIRMF